MTLDDAENQYKCLSLHHSKLDGRVINVERSCGGKNVDKRKQKITALRDEQKEVLKSTCDRILQEKIEAGVLKKEELDEQAVGLLTRYDGATASAILDNYCAEERERLRNPSAFFMMLAKRVVEEGIPSPEAAATGAGASAGAAKKREEGVGGEHEKKKPRRSEAPVATPTAAKMEEGQGDHGDHHEEDEDDEERGWGTPAYGDLGGSSSSSARGSGSSGFPLTKRGGSHAPSGRSAGGGAGGDDYDISHVFGSMRGRGGFRGAARGGRGGGGRGREGRR